MTEPPATIMLSHLHHKSISKSVESEEERCQSGMQQPSGQVKARKQPLRTQVGMPATKDHTTGNEASHLKQATERKQKKSDSAHRRPFVGVGMTTTGSGGSAAFFFSFSSTNTRNDEG